MLQIASPRTVERMSKQLFKDTENSNLDSNFGETFATTYHVSGLFVFTHTQKLHHAVYLSLPFAPNK